MCILYTYIYIYEYICIKGTYIYIYIYNIYIYIYIYINLLFFNLLDSEETWRPCVVLKRWLAFRRRLQARSRAPQEPPTSLQQ